MAAIKAFIAQLVALFLLALKLAQARQRLSEQDAQTHRRALRHLPDAMTKVLALAPQIIGWAAALARRTNN